MSVCRASVSVLRGGVSLRDHGRRGGPTKFRTVEPGWTTPRGPAAGWVVVALFLGLAGTVVIAGDGKVATLAFGALALLILLLAGAPIAVRNLYGPPRDSRKR